MPADHHKKDWTPGPARAAAAIALCACGLLALASSFSSAGPSAPPLIPGVALSTIDLNAADLPELESLPGIGPSTARRIIEHRTANGRFDSVDGLDAVKGVGPVTIERLRPFVSAN